MFVQSLIVMCMTGVVPPSGWLFVSPVEMEGCARDAGAIVRGYATPEQTECFCDVTTPEGLELSVSCSCAHERKKRDAREVRKG